MVPEMLTFHVRNRSSRFCKTALFESTMRIKSMKINIGTNPVRRVRNINATVAMILVLLVELFVAVSVVSAQSETNQPRITTIMIEPNQIAPVRTAQKISSRISFSEPVKMVICGDLYDPESGTGSFVIQTIGNDVFIKPVVASGTSNMFVKAGEDTYNFSLEIYPANQAHIVLNVRNTGSKIVLAGNQPKQPGASRLHPPSPVPVGAVSLERVDPLPGLPQRMLAIGGLGALPLTNMAELPAPPPPPMANNKSNRVSDVRADNPAAILGDPVKMVSATYPDYARRLGQTGAVEVEVIVDESGKVISAKAISGHNMLKEAAVTAARGWKFNPTKVNGAAVRAVGRITFDFQREPGRGFDTIPAGVFGIWKRIP